MNSIYRQGHTPEKQNYLVELQNLHIINKTEEGETAKYCYAITYKGTRTTKCELQDEKSVYTQSYG